MPNAHVLQRLTGLQTILNGVHQSGVSMSSASKGEERATFVDQFLSKVLPPIYRFGSGDATDVTGKRSGQLDVVVEFPFAPSLPVVGAGQTRLYLAESVAAVIEVKSNLAGQWSEASKTGDDLAPLARQFGNSMSYGGPPPPRIPLYVVGYTGWAKLQTLEQHLAASPNVDGALIIDAGIYLSKSGLSVAGSPLALWGLICDLHRITNSLQSANTDPTLYAR